MQLGIRLADDQEVLHSIQPGGHPREGAAFNSVEMRILMEIELNYSAQKYRF